MGIAASAEAGIAEAQLYPSLTLSGNISLAQVATGGTVGWSFGPTLNLPFLDGGQARANHQVALSRVEQAYIAWQAAVLGAIEEAENALRRFVEMAAASMRRPSSRTVQHDNWNWRG